MSNLIKLTIPGVGRHKGLITPKELFEVVKRALQDRGVDPERCEVAYSEQASLEVASYFGNRNEGPVHVRWDQQKANKAWLPQYGQFAGVRIEQDGQISLIADLWGQGVRGKTAVQGSQAWQALYSVQKRILQLELSKSLGIGMEEAWQAMKDYKLEEYDEDRIERLRLAMTFSKEFGIPRARAFEAANSLKLTSKGLAELRKQLQLSDTLLNDLPIEDIELVAKKLGFNVDTNQAVLSPDLDRLGVGAARISGTRRLVLKGRPNIQFVVTKKEATVKDLATRKPSKVMRWVLTGNKKSVDAAKGKLEQLQTLCSVLWDAKALIAKTFPDAQANMTVMKKNGDFIVVLQEVTKKVQAHGVRQVADVLGMTAEDLQTTVDSTPQLVQVLRG